MNSHLAMTRNDESGFTLVELLVVIAIIAILTAIAVPSFLSQRAKANDASVRSDMKSVVTTIETALIDNSGDVSVETDAGVAEVIVGTATSNVKLSKGVTVSSTDDSTAARYVLNGTHEGGNAVIQYDSGNGGFVASGSGSSDAGENEDPGIADPIADVKADIMYWANAVEEAKETGATGGLKIVQSYPSRIYALSVQDNNYLFSQPDYVRPAGTDGSYFWFGGDFISTTDHYILRGSVKGSDPIIWVTYDSAVGDYVDELPTS